MKPVHGLSKFDRRPAPGELWVLCWCGEEYVGVPDADVARCTTRPCGRLGCAEPEGFTEWCW